MAMGGPWAAILSVALELACVSYVERKSTSAGLRNTETGDEFPGNGGLHIYVILAEQTDLKRFLKDLHTRLVAAGFGWPYMTEGGAVEMRSLVDYKVGQGSRLIFEGEPLVLAPFEQDAEARKADMHEREKDVVDSRIAVPSVTTAEQREHDRLLTEAKRHFAPEVEKIRKAKAEKLEERFGKSEGKSKAARAC
jgi:hypothetical protein